MEVVQLWEIFTLLIDTRFSLKFHIRLRTGWILLSVNFINFLCQNFDLCRKERKDQIWCTRFFFLTWREIDLDDRICNYKSFNRRCKLEFWKNPITIYRVELKKSAIFCENWIIWILIEMSDFLLFIGQFSSRNAKKKLTMIVIKFWEIIFFRLNIEITFRVLDVKNWFFHH